MAKGRPCSLFHQTFAFPSANSNTLTRPIKKMEHVFTETCCWETSHPDYRSSLPESIWTAAYMLVITFVGSNVCDIMCPVNIGHLACKYQPP